MKKLKICVTVNLNDPDDKSMNTVQDFDSKTGDFYAKTESFLSELFDNSNEERKQNITLNSHNSRFEITGVYKEIQAEE